MRYNITESLDACGHLCPVPILMTEEKMAELKEGETLEVLFTDPGVKPDLKAWCAATGNEFLGFKDEKKRSAAYVRKKRAA